MAAYYPRRVATIKDLQKAYKGFDEGLETHDEEEEERLEHVALVKQRGKGAPKKKRTADGELIWCWILGWDNADCGACLQRVRSLRGRRREGVRRRRCREGDWGRVGVMQESITGCLNIAMEYLGYGYNEDLRCIFAAFITSTGCWPNKELKDGCIKTKSQ